MSDEQGYASELNKQLPSIKYLKYFFLFIYSYFLFRFNNCSSFWDSWRVTSHLFVFSLSYDFQRVVCYSTKGYPVSLFILFNKYNNILWIFLTPKQDMQQLAAKCKRVIWVTVGGAFSVSSPSLSPIVGLSRVLR